MQSEILVPMKWEFMEFKTHEILIEKSQYDWDRSLVNQIFREKTFAFHKIKENSIFGSSKSEDVCHMISLFSENFQVLSPIGCRNSQPKRGGIWNHQDLQIINLLPKVTCWILSLMEPLVRKVGIQGQREILKTKDSSLVFVKCNWTEKWNNYVDKTL